MKRSRQPCRCTPTLCCEPHQINLSKTHQWLQSTTLPRARLLPLLRRSLTLIDSILTRVGLLIIHQLRELVVPGRETGTHEWPQPVDPVITREISVDDAGSKRAHGVQATAGVEDAHQLRYEEGETDANGGEEGSLGFLGREHEDGDDEEGGQEHFEEEALSGGGAVGEGGIYGERSGQKDVDDGGGADAG